MADTLRELTTSELDAVSGGALNAYNLGITGNGGNGGGGGAGGRGGKGGFALADNNSTANANGGAGGAGGALTQRAANVIRREFEIDL